MRHNGENRIRHNNDDIAIRIKGNSPAKKFKRRAHVMQCAMFPLLCTASPRGRDRRLAVKGAEGGKSIIASWRSVVYLGFRMHAEIQVRRSGDVGFLLAQERSMNKEKCQNTLRLEGFQGGAEPQLK